jgi:hypothetical protein
MTDKQITGELNRLKAPVVPINPYPQGPQLIDTRMNKNGIISNEYQ